MTDAVTQYKIYCETEAKFVSGWGQSPPTVCYNNNAHSVNTNSIQVVNVISSSIVSINQNDVTRSGRFILETISIPNVAGGTTSTISLHAFNFALNAAETGDLFSIVVRPDTPLGLIASDMTSGDTVVPISPYIIPYLTAGMYLTLTDGTNSNGPTKILLIDSVNYTVTLKTAVTHNYSASNTQMLLNYYIIKDMAIILGTTYSFGGEIINSSTVPAGTTATFSFTNNGSTTKSVAVYLTGVI
jgi:hypothetical protein